MGLRQVRRLTCLTNVHSRVYSMRVRVHWHVVRGNTCSTMTRVLGQVKLITCHLQGL